MSLSSDAVSVISHWLCLQRSHPFLTPLYVLQKTWRIFSDLSLPHSSLPLFSFHIKRNIMWSVYLFILPECLEYVQSKWFYLHPE